MKILLQAKNGMKDIADILLLVEGWYDDELFQVNKIKCVNPNLR